MASEDFGVYAQHVPACLVFLGGGTEPGRGGTPLHSHDYVFNDDVLGAGVAFFVRLVRDSLPGALTRWSCGLAHEDGDGVAEVESWVGVVGGQRFRGNVGCRR